MSSTYQILRHNELLLQVTDKWSQRTNTFIFPWGEATITLEDMIVLGGFSVLGESVLNSLKGEENLNLREGLIEAHKHITTANGVACTHTPWMEHFMGSGDKLEHVAFLSLWLSRYVFPENQYITVGKDLFPIAIRLSRGTRIALAPAVLASIYTDLSFMKRKIEKARSNIHDGSQKVEVWSPFQIVQAWIWERFPTLRPKPNMINPGNPRVARWHNVHKLKLHGKKTTPDENAGDCFQWRPYAAQLGNHSPPYAKFYKDKEEWIDVNPDMENEILCFARCIRCSELVGLDCIRQYLPNRVAMQFGFDQDTPGHVPRYNQKLRVAWKNYNRPIGDERLYVPARLFESDVTRRYKDWWEQSLLNERESLKRKRSPTRDFKPEIEAGDAVRQSKLRVIEKKKKHYASLNTILKREQSQVSWTDVCSIPHENARFDNGENTNGCSEKLQMEARISNLEKELAQLKSEYDYRFGNKLGNEYLSHE